MNIFLSHSVNLYFQVELSQPLKNSTICTKHDVYFPHDTDSPVNTMEVIQNSDLILAEVSISATGQGIELGWASSVNVPIICFYKVGTIPANSIKFISKNLFSYSNEADLISQLNSLV